MVERAHRKRLSLARDHRRDQSPKLQSGYQEPEHGGCRARRPILMLEKYRKHQAEIGNLRASLKSELEKALK